MKRKHNFKDLTGLRFGRLTPVEYVPICKWKCRCDCGTIKIIPTENLQNATKSCGCLRHEINSEVQRKLHTTHGLHKSPEYTVWAAMKARCSNPKTKLWKDYGGRGVRVCDEWNEFSKFYADMGPRPSPKHSLDRKDNGLLYSKDTCRWATDVEQHNNTRRNRLVTWRGETKTVAQWARDLGLKYRTLMARIQRNWVIDEAMVA